MERISNLRKNLRAEAESEKKSILDPRIKDKHDLSLLKAWGYHIKIANILLFFFNFLPFWGSKGERM